MSYDSLNPSIVGRPCPFRGRKPCPGEINGCVFWRRQDVDMGGKARVIENCIFILQFELTCQQVSEQIRTQSTINALNNQAFVNMIALHKGIMPRPLSGRSEEDKKAISEVIDVDQG